MYYEFNFRLVTILLYYITVLKMSFCSSPKIRNLRTATAKNLNNGKYYFNLRMMFNLFLDSMYINFNDEQPLKFLMFHSE